MLVVSRKVNQSVELPGLGVVIRVTDLKRSRVQLGIEAPATVRVRRGEMTSRPVDVATESGRSVNCSVNGVRSISELGAGEPGHDWGDELRRMELQIAALAELANAHDRQVARQVAGDAIDRLAGMRRRIATASGGANAIARGGVAGETLCDGDLGSGRGVIMEGEAASGCEPESELEGVAEVRQERAGYRVEVAA